MGPSWLGSIRIHGPLKLVAWLQAMDEKLWWREKTYANAKKLTKLPCNCNVCHGA